MTTTISRRPEKYSLVEEYLSAVEARISTILKDSGSIDTHQVKKEIYRLHHMRSRYVWTMYKDGKIDTQLYKYLCAKQLVDIDLVSYWKKPGYENLCCLRCVDTITKTGRQCLCRVPGRYVDPEKFRECKHCGCLGCSGH